MKIFPGLFRWSEGRIAIHADLATLDLVLTTGCQIASNVAHWLGATIRMRPLAEAGRRCPT